MRAEEPRLLLEEAPWQEPEAVYALCRQCEGSAFLDSSLAGGKTGRYSIVAPQPAALLQLDGEATVWNGQLRRQDAFALLRQWQAAHRLPAAAAAGLPFVAGAIGFFGYDLGRRWERVQGRASQDVAMPELWLGLHEGALVFDHLQQKVWLTALDVAGRGEARLAQWRRLLAGTRPLAAPAAAPSLGPCFTNMTKEEYLCALERVIAHIFSGDIFQANLTRRLHCRTAEDPYEVYRRLRRSSPAPFAAYLNAGALQVASASPERYLRLRGDCLETRPIKGTRPRGATAAEDAALRSSLWQSEKDRAELTMITDLQRNDLGRSCVVGSVQVPELFRLEEYATVFHLVSVVTGRLLPEKDVLDVVAASFPGGSITGAPKVRAMQILDDLEPTWRGLYTGSLGYLDVRGHADLNIVIRTVLFSGGNAYVQTGGGIVAQSLPEQEYAETLHKARALLAALGCRPPRGEEMP